MSAEVQIRKLQSLHAAAVSISRHIEDLRRQWQAIGHTPTTRDANPHDIDMALLTAESALRLMALEFHCWEQLEQEQFAMYGNDVTGEAL